jgi:amino acid transporter
MKAVLSFIHDHLWLVLAALILGALFFWVGHFGEFIYAAIRLIAVVVVAAAVLHWKFPQTLHKYINEDRLIADFNSLDPKHRVYVAFGTLAILFVVSALCFVHP